jgi:hypothetical protein
LVRYIHRNPLKAGLVKRLDQSPIKHIYSKNWGHF